MFTSRIQHIAEPDQLASQKLADLDLQCFDNSVHSNDYFHLIPFRVGVKGTFNRIIMVL